MYLNPILLPQMTNRESWSRPIGFWDDDTGDPIALTDDAGNPIVTFQLEVRPSFRGSGQGGGGSWGGPYYDRSASFDCSPLLRATLGNGITIVDINVILIYFAESSMRQLSPGTYDVGCTMATIDGIDVRQLFRAKLPIVAGFVAA